MRKFWNWVKNENQRTLYFDGCIAEESWFGDEITPRQFKSELFEDQGDIAVWINSPGGDVIAASQIYTMLKEYSGQVTIKIDGIAASAASVIAMAGDYVQMSPTAVLMIHNPATAVFGEVADLQGAIEMLGEIKESIINAYEQKTQLSRTKIAHMMDAETWFSANKAVELGFADGVLYHNEQAEKVLKDFMFDKLTITNAWVKKMPKAKVTPATNPIHEPTPKFVHGETPKSKETPLDNQMPIAQFDKRLELLKP